MFKFQKNVNIYIDKYLSSIFNKNCDSGVFHMEQLFKNTRWF